MIRNIVIFGDIRSKASGCKTRKCYEVSLIDSKINRYDALCL